MKFLTIRKCGMIDIEDIRKKEWLSKYQELSRTGGTITHSTYGAEHISCGTCKHGELHKLPKPVPCGIQYGHYEVKCPGLVLRDGQRLIPGWVEGELQ